MKFAVPLMLFAAAGAVILCWSAILFRRLEAQWYEVS
jgi:hypothetical protein